MNGASNQTGHRSSGFSWLGSSSPLGQSCVKTPCTAGTATKPRRRRQSTRRLAAIVASRLTKKGAVNLYSIGSSYGKATILLGNCMRSRGLDCRGAKWSGTSPLSVLLLALDLLERPLLIFNIISIFLFMCLWSHLIGKVSFLFSFFVDFRSSSISSLRRMTSFELDAVVPSSIQVFSWKHIWS